MNASPHQKAILIFGVVIPFVLIFGLVGLTLHGRGKLNKSHKDKVALYERFKSAKTQVYELEATMSTGDKREEIAFWKSKTDKDFIEVFSESVTSILANFDDSVLRQTAMGPANGSGSIATAAYDTPHTRIKIDMEGGFKPMQLFMAELESEMPQLILESISIVPAMATGDEGGKLKFHIIYLGWEKAQA